MIIQGPSGNVVLNLYPEDRALTDAELRARVLDPVRAAYLAHYPNEAGEYDAAERGAIEQWRMGR